MQKRCACFRSPGATSQNHGYQPLSLTVGPLSVYGHLVAVWLKSNTVIGGRVVPLSAAATETGHPERPIYSHIDDSARRSFALRRVVPRPGERTGGVPRRRKTERGVTLTVDYLLCSDSAICAGAFVRSTESGFSFRLSYVPQHSESDTAADRCSLHAARAAPWSRFLAVLTSVSTFRLEFSGLGPRGFAR